LSVIVAQNGIYAYVQNTRTYSLVRNETYQATKDVWRNQGNLVIYTREQATGNNFNFKLQFNSISPTAPISISKINETLGQSHLLPNIAVSRRLSKVVLSAIDPADNTKAVYVAKNVDWLGKNTKDIALTPAVTSSFNLISVSDDFLYARNTQTVNPKQFGYALVGTVLAEAFNENAVVTSEGYTRSFLIPDSANTGKMVVVHQYNNNEFVRLSKDLKKNSQEILNPNQVPPFDMTFNYGANDLQRLATPAFGRWIWSSGIGTTLNWIEYDPTQTGKKKTITESTLLSGSSLINLSPGFDCAISMYPGSNFDTVKFDNTNAGSSSKINHWAVVSADNSNNVLTNAVST
jgi:hypothetical protein